MIPDFNMIACTKCGGDINLATWEYLLCADCGMKFFIEGDVFNFIDETCGKEAAKKDWETRLGMFLAWRKERQSVKLESRSGGLLERFGSFADIRSGIVLDIGCASGDLQNYIRCEQYWGVDPVPFSGMGFPLLMALGEKLPFKKNVFDHVILSQVLDHCMDPVEALREAARVVKHGGLIHILQYVIDDDKRFFDLVRTKLKRFLGFSARIHSWETKPRRLRKKELIKLILEVSPIARTSIDETLLESQMIVTIRVQK